MTEKTLINKEDITIGSDKFFISSIPAIPAQRMLLKAIGAFTKGSVADIPSDLLTELLSYAGAYNKAGTEVQFVDEEVVDLMVKDPMTLIEIEERMVEKNFGFLADGRLAQVMERLAAAFNRKSGTDTPNT